jgi:membrane protein implicated in regulation of membrane protease activity
MIGGAILCYQLFLDQIWQQVILQIIYWFMNIVGWITWYRKDKEEKARKGD